VADQLWSMTRIREEDYSQGRWTDFDTNYAKTCGSEQGCAFLGVISYLDPNFPKLAPF